MTYHICADNRFEIINKAKQHLLEATNIDTSPDEMKVLDNFLFRCWQMGWLKDYECESESRKSDQESYKIGFHEGYEEAEIQREINETIKWDSPFATIAEKLPLVNIEMIEEIEKCMSDIVAENWDYFGELICCYKQEFKGVVGWEFEHGDHLKITVFTLDGYKYFTCDLRCFTDENFLKEKINEKL